MDPWDDRDDYYDTMDDYHEEAQCEDDGMTMDGHFDGGDPWDDDNDRSMFADPGGNSALRAAGPGNPRNLPCPTCEAPSRLTPEDVDRGYQCDSFADSAERGY